MKALSLYAPWVVAIVHYGKDIENRDWRTNYRGRILIHASREKSRKHTLDESVAVLKTIERRFGNRGPVVMAEELERVVLAAQRLAGHIVAATTIVGCATKSESKWFVGPYGFELSNTVALPEPVPCKGQKGFWDVPREAADAIRELAKHEAT